MEANCTRCATLVGVPEGVRFGLRAVSPACYGDARRDVTDMNLMSSRRPCSADTEETGAYLQHRHAAQENLSDLEHI